MHTAFSQYGLRHHPIANEQDHGVILLDAEPTSRAALADQVACLGSIGDATNERLRHEALTVPSGWITAYGDYQSGGWGTLSLLNATGNATDVTIADCADPVETPLLAEMPATRALLHDLGLRYMWVRLARLEPGGFLWEHRDYVELSDAERYRLHIPVQTNSSAYLVTGGTAVHMAAGGLWNLTPTYAHGVCNLRGPARIHIIADCYSNEAFERLVAGGRLPGTGVRRLPAATDGDLARCTETAADLAALGWTDVAEQYLLRLLYVYALPEGRIYDLIADLHAHRGDTAAADSWRHKKAVMLGTADKEHTS